MSISDLYSTGEHLKNLGHFASMVKMAKIDNIITEGEQTFLERKARNLNITDEEFKSIIKNTDTYPINPPAGYDESISRLYRLTNILYADDTPSMEEVNFLKKIIIGLSFKIENVDKIASESVHLIMNNNDEEDFIKAIKNVNS